MRDERKRKLFGTPPMDPHGVKHGAAFAEAWGRNSDCALAQTQSAPRQMALSGEASDSRWSHGPMAAMAGKSMEIIELPSGNLT